MKQYKYVDTGLLKGYKTTEETVWLNNQVIDEVNQLLELYYDKYELRDKISISRCCNIGLMMLASLSADELANVVRWYKGDYE